jgi:hypothetical protein
MTRLSIVAKEMFNCEEKMANFEGIRRERKLRKNEAWEDPVST